MIEVDKQIAKELTIELIRTNNLSYDGFPNAKNPVDLVCAAYKQIKQTVTAN